LRSVSEAKIKGWCSSMMSNEVALEELITARGLTTKTVSEYEIGWDSGRNCYTIPIRSAEGEILNIRRYQTRPPKGRRKIWGIEGMNQPRLYPVKALESDEIILCEGELDALITNQNGFSAVTKTGAAMSWDAKWNNEFKDKVVYLCHDCDETGQNANRKIGRFLAGIAREIRIMHLPYPIEEKNGKDLTDWWMEHDQDTHLFKRIMEESEPFDPNLGSDEPERLDPTDTTALEALDSRMVGKPVRLTVTIKGKREPGYSVPRKVRFRCTRDAGVKCNFCPLFATGDDERIIAGSDPVVLAMMDSTDKQAKDAARSRPGS
jgi:5S rRNA maturation endonuclease (ribonuclease M5)